MQKRILSLALTLTLVLSGCSPNKFLENSNNQTSELSKSSEDTNSNVLTKTESDSADDFPDTPVSAFSYNYDGELKGVVITGYNGGNALKVRIPDKIEDQPVVAIGGNSTSGAFYGTTIMSVYIPNTVKEIGQKAFMYSQLTSITIPNSVTSIGDWAFDFCKGLTSVTLPDSLTSINSQVFANCEGLTSITIPDSVTTIEGSAFWDCTGLTSVTIPENVTNIESDAFEGCTSLTDIKISSDNTVYTDVDGVVFSKEMKKLIIYPQGKIGAYIIPDGVTTIDVAAFGGAFSGSIDLTDVTIPDSVTTIENSAFRHCEGLTSVTIPNSVTGIGEYAFERCTGLTSVTIPDSVTSLGDHAFQGCTGLDENTRKQKISHFI